MIIPQVTQQYGLKNVLMPLKVEIDLGLQPCPFPNKSPQGAKKGCFQIFSSPEPRREQAFPITCGPASVQHT
jgi:hypothetical protein